MFSISCFFFQLTTMGPNASFTMIFGEFLESTNQAGSVLTILNSIFNISYSLAGMFPFLMNLLYTDANAHLFIYFFFY